MNPPKFENGVASLALDEDIYSLEAILRACYWLTDRAYVFVSRPAIRQLLVTIRAKDSKPSLENPNPTTVEAIAGEFQNTLLDHELRVRIEHQTRGVRELIVAKALTGIPEEPPPGEVRDPVQVASALTVLP